jgi:uncharacterized membrane protein
MRKSEIIIVGLIMLSFFTSVYLYPLMPDKLASHWNIGNKVNGYLPKFYALFLMPFISVGLFLLFITIPKIDPLKKNILKFMKYYDRFVTVIVGFLFYLYILMILWNIGIVFNTIQVMMPAFGVVFYFCGDMIENAKRNWFIGIRTPWTLSSDKVWDKTHKVGGRLFRILGVIAIFSAFVTDLTIWFVFIPLVLVVAYLVVYSYVEFKKLRR